MFILLIEVHLSTKILTFRHTVVIWPLTIDWFSALVEIAARLIIQIQQLF